MGDAGIIEKVESLRNCPAASRAPPHSPTVCLGLWVPDGQTGVLALLETGTTWDPKFRHL